MVGTVTIGSTDGGAVDEAKRQIQLILNPPTAEVGQVYPGQVVNITKFGAFVNILPGRDGLLHISKLGGGKRIDRVEDVLDLGDEIEVRVDDVDPSGKVSPQPGRRRSAARRAAAAAVAATAAVTARPRRGERSTARGERVGVLRGRVRRRAPRRVRRPRARHGRRPGEGRRRPRRTRWRRRPRRRVGAAPAEPQPR